MTDPDDKAGPFTAGETAPHDQVTLSSPILIGQYFNKNVFIEIFYDDLTICQKIQKTIPSCEDQIGGGGGRWLSQRRTSGEERRKSLGNRRKKRQLPP